VRAASLDNNVVMYLSARLTEEVACVGNWLLVVTLFVIGRLMETTWTRRVGS
jgi:hypothetical protein